MIETETKRKIKEMEKKPEYFDGIQVPGRRRRKNICQLIYIISQPTLIPESTFFEKRTEKKNLILNYSKEIIEIGTEEDEEIRKKKHRIYIFHNVVFSRMMTKAFSPRMFGFQKVENKFPSLLLCKPGLMASHEQPHSSPSLFPRYEN